MVCLISDKVFNEKIKNKKLPCAYIPAAYLVARWFIYKSDVDEYSRSLCRPSFPYPSTSVIRQQVTAFCTPYLTISKYLLTSKWGRCRKVKLETRSKWHNLHLPPKRKAGSSRPRIGVEVAVIQQVHSTVHANILLLDFHSPVQITTAIIITIYAMVKNVSDGRISTTKSNTH